MVSPDTAMQLLQDHGLWLLAPVAIIEGPIATVIAGYLGHLGFLNLYVAFVVVVLADLVGDTLFYWLGARGIGWISPRWRVRLGLHEQRLADIARHYKTQGGRTLVIGKLTHSLGMVALVAAGVARMRFWPFLGYNLVATIPKSGLFLLLGYSLGYAYQQVNAWIFWLSLVPLAALGLYLLFRYLSRKKPLD